MIRMTYRTHMQAAAAAVVFALTMVSATGALASPTRVPSASTQKSQKTANPLPTMSVTDVKSSKPFALASAFDGKKALLVWFWAPH